MGGQYHAPATLPPGKTWYPLYRRLGGPQGRSGRMRKILPPPGFDPQTVQPVASRYTDRAIPSTWTAEIMVWFLAGVRDTCLIQNNKTHSGAHPASCSGYLVFCLWEQSCQGVKLTTRLSLMLRLIMSGAIPLPSTPLMHSWCTQGQLYIFRDKMASVMCSGAYLHFPWIGA